VISWPMAGAVPRTDGRTDGAWCVVVVISSRQPGVRLVNALVEVALEHADAKTLLKTLHVMWPRPQQPPPPIEGQAPGQQLDLHEQDPQGMMVLDRGALLQVGTQGPTHPPGNHPVCAAYLEFRAGGAWQMRVPLPPARPPNNQHFARSPPPRLS
jgi:hypothetical protein